MSIQCYLMVWLMSVACSELCSQVMIQGWIAMMKFIAIFYFNICILHCHYFKEKLFIQNSFISLLIWICLKQDRHYNMLQHTQSFILMTDILIHTSFTQFKHSNNVCNNAYFVSVLSYTIYSGLAMNMYFIFQS